MKKYIKKHLRKFCNWVLADDIKNITNRLCSLELTAKTKLEIMELSEASVDVHNYSPSWAVLSLRGKHSDYIKFMNLGDADLRTIHQFLSQFEDTKIDAAPMHIPALMDKWHKF